MPLQAFYDSCLVALFKGTPFPRARGNNQEDMLHDFRTTMGQFHRSRWHEEATDIGLEYGLETEALLNL
jgi:hypothetical protein